jgi:peroxiredoxin
MQTNEDGMVEVGSTLPDFRLPANTGKEVGPADYLGKSNLVLFFVREFN